MKRFIEGVGGIALAALALCQPSQAATLAVAKPTPVAAPMRTVNIPDKVFGYASYAVGRCYVHLTDSGKQEAYRFMNRQREDIKNIMFTAYYAGIQDSRTKPLDRAQCDRLLAEMQAELAKYIR